GQLVVPHGTILYLAFGDSSLQKRPFIDGHGSASRNRHVFI
ncbi:unnamed protein product, partial [Rotaria socialis]